MRTRMTGLAAVAVLALLGGAAAAQDKAGPKKHLLVITESKGFRHGCVARRVDLAKDVDLKAPPKIDGLEIRVSKNKDGVEKAEAFYHGRVPSGKPFELRADGKVVAVVKPAVVEEFFFDLADRTGQFDVVCSQDSRKEIVAENLKHFDAVFFYTTGSLPLSDTQKADLLGFVKSGKGFAGSHSATDTLYNWKEYGELIGGYFDGHPWHTKITVVVEDKKHPATKHLGDSFVITDEIYQFRAPYSRDKLHVLMRLEPQWAASARQKELEDIEKAKQELPEKLAKLEAAGKKDEAKKLKQSVEGRKPGIRRTDNDYALAWTREFGKGRVFYTALGHRDELWRDPRFQQHVLGGLRYVFRVED
jgi:type 1 glutamine amidotransferase